MHREQKGEFGRCENKESISLSKALRLMTDYTGKAELSKGKWNPPRKLGITTLCFKDN